jgi:hypothetical protein
VEDCLTLSAASLVRRKALVAGARTSGTWCWTVRGRGGGARHDRLRGRPARPGRRLAPAALPRGGEPVDHRVRLAATRPAYGGLRWWFVCPLARRDGGPPRRVAKLHLPPGGRYFGGRAAHGLTYASCQESGRFRGLFRHIAAELGTDEAGVRRALGRRRPSGDGGGAREIRDGRTGRDSC